MRKMLSFIFHLKNTKLHYILTREKFSVYNPLEKIMCHINHICFKLAIHCHAIKYHLQYTERNHQLKKLFKCCITM